MVERMAAVPRTAMGERSDVVLLTGLPRRAVTKGIGGSSPRVQQWRSANGEGSMIAKRLMLCLVVATGIGLSNAGDARAQTYPNHALKIVVPYPAGGPTDVLARLVAEKLSAVFGQCVTAARP